MEHLIETFIKQKINFENALGLVFMENELQSEGNIDFDAFLVIVLKKEVMQKTSLSHYEIGSKLFQVQIINERDLVTLLMNENNHHFVDCLMNGIILIEKNESITKLRKQIIDFPLINRKVKLTIEFAKLIKRYMDGKKLFHKGHILDAFHSLLQSLHHLARLSIIEQGIYPEVTVWQQVKHLEPEIFKLYEEMIVGEESLEKKIELLLIANNFAITSKTKMAASHLIEIMSEKSGSWGIEELVNHNELEEYNDHLVMLVEYLVQKGIIDIVKLETEVEDVYNRTYYIKK